MNKYKTKILLINSAAWKWTLNKSNFLNLFLFAVKLNFHKNIKWGPKWLYDISTNNLQCYTEVATWHNCYVKIRRVIKSIQEPKSFTICLFATNSKFKCMQTIVQNCWLHKIWANFGENVEVKIKLKQRRKIPHRFKHIGKENILLMIKNV